MYMWASPLLKFYSIKIVNQRTKWLFTIFQKSEQQLHLTIKMPGTSCWVTLYWSTFLNPCQIIHIFITVNNSIHYFAQYFKQVLPSCFSRRKNLQKMLQGQAGESWQTYLLLQLENKVGIHAQCSKIYIQYLWILYHSPLQGLSTILLWDSNLYIYIFSWLSELYPTSSSSATFLFWKTDYLDLEQLSYLDVLILICISHYNKQAPSSTCCLVYFVHNIYIGVRQLFWVLIFEYTDRSSSLSRS